MAYKKAKRDRKEEIIRLRVTTEQKTQMVEAAKKVGLEVSAWLRAMGVQEARRIEYVEHSQLPPGSLVLTPTRKKRKAGADARG